MSDFMLLGDQAELAIARGFKNAGGVFTHQQPDEPEGTAYDDMTDMSSVQVGRWLQYFTGMHAFCIGLCAKADLEYTSAKSQFNLFKKIKQAELTDKHDKMPAWQLEAEIAKTEEYAKLYSKVVEKEALAEAYKAQVKSLELQAALYSREITRREGEK